MPARVLYDKGHRFEGTYLTVLDNLPTSGIKSRVLCVCDYNNCGKKFSINVDNITSGKTKSCGCLRDKKASERLKTHGLSKHPLYRVWHGMIERCDDEKHISYKWFGGRGVSVCKSWRNDFKAFFDYAMEHGWKRRLNIDRINTDGNYEPGNVRFVTSKENMRNKRNNRVLTIGGITASLTEHAERAGINRQAVSRRFHLGWKVEDLLKPLRGQTI